MINLNVAQTFKTSILRALKDLEDKYDFSSKVENEEFYVDSSLQTFIEKSKGYTSVLNFQNFIKDNKTV